MSQKPFTPQNTFQVFSTKPGAPFIAPPSEKINDLPLTYTQAGPLGEQGHPGLHGKKNRGK